ncbi:MAG: hypothetical protein ABI175_05480 [Polyangiales bacterium]
MSKIARASLLVVTATLILAIEACASRQKPQSGGAVTGGPAQNTPNQWCELYCQKTADCWGSVPNAEPNKPREQIIADCRAGSNGCQVAQTTDTLCCATQVECANFAGCAFSAQNAAATCR